MNVRQWKYHVIYENLMKLYLGNIFHISSDAAKFFPNVLQVSAPFHHFFISCFCVGEVFWKLEALCNEEQREQNALKCQTCGLREFWRLTTNLFKQFLMANYVVIAWLYLVVFLPPKIGGKKGWISWDSLYVQRKVYNRRGKCSFPMNKMY